MSEIQKYKMTALTRVGRVKPLSKGATFTGTLMECYNRLDNCFINGCEIERVGKTSKWKVYAGYGSHVADIKLVKVRR